MRPTHLAVFDFDNTLFRSPEKPGHWPEGKGWWGRLESLTAPCVPSDPSPEWWNEELVEIARAMIASSDTLAVLLTGRLRGRFDERIQDLLGQAGLEFDEVHLSRGGTLTFKLETIRRIMAARPEIVRVSLWDDREEHLAEFAALFKDLGVAYRIFLVERASLSALC